MLDAFSSAEGLATYSFFRHIYMFMDRRRLGTGSGVKFRDEAVLPCLDQYQNLVKGMKFAGPSLEAPPNAEGDSPSDDTDFSDTVLKYISQMLMEEDMEEKPCMFHDPLALQAAEKSFAEALSENYSVSPNKHPLSVESSDDIVAGSSSSSTECTSSSCSSSLNTISADNRWKRGFREEKPSILQSPLPANFVFQSKSQSLSSSGSTFADGDTNGVVDTPVSELLVQDLFNDSESMLQFQRGVEEASKFLPKTTQLILDVGGICFAPQKERAEDAEVELEKEEREHSPPGFSGKKNHEREDMELEEERSNKQSAVYFDETHDGELAEMFDKVLLGCFTKFAEIETSKKPHAEEHSTVTDGGKTPSRNLQPNGQVNVSNGGKTTSKKQGSKKGLVDLSALLVVCAQSVSADDRKTAVEMLKQIRQHSSPFGDGTQRVAHCFANALEARLAGTGTQIYTSLASKRNSAADMLKAYQVYISACPFLKFAMIFANHAILKLAEKASTLHIIDFGILYGFQWPGVIARLSRRPGGPPRLRITGIELPQSGFRPAERVQETGRRLARYCERFNVPFEFNAIAQKWETIQLQDLKINSDEALAVNCLFRFKNLLDETVVADSPRNAVLQLIRDVNPHIFLHSIVNGSYNAPFFVTRFREAFFHYSALFDIFDTNFTREDPMRLMFEREFNGREIMNVVACEGSGRVERPETYKQWQFRNMRAGFRQVPLDRELVKRLRLKLKERSYHSHFMIDEDGHWMLQGWKGRILYASSCWVPA